MDYRVIFRARTGWYYFAFFVAAAVIFTVVVTLSDGPLQMLRTIGVPYAMVVWGWWAWVWPICEMSSQGLLVRNMFRTIVIPWRAVTSVEPRLGLYVEAPVAAHESKRFYVSAVPARGGLGSTKDTKETPPELRFERSPAPTVTVGPSAAARMIEEERFYLADPKARPEPSGNAQRALARHRDADFRQEPLFPADVTVRKYATVRWNIIPIVLGASAVLAVLAYFVF